MARDFIKINTNDTAATQAANLKRYITTLRDAYEQGKAVKSIMDHMQDGSVFTDIEAFYGLPAGKGQTVYNFMNGSIGSMEGIFQTSDAKNITETVG